MTLYRDSSIYCVPKYFHDKKEVIMYGIICMMTSIVGFVGAGQQLKALWPYRDSQRRKPSANPRIIFYLALSNLFLCLGTYPAEYSIIKCRRKQVWFGGGEAKRFGDTFAHGKGTLRIDSIYHTSSFDMRFVF